MAGKCGQKQLELEAEGSHPEPQAGSRESKLKMVPAFNSQNPPPAIDFLHQATPPKQHLQLQTKGSNTPDFGGQFSFKPPQSIHSGHLILPLSKLRKYSYGCHEGCLQVPRGVVMSSKPTGV